MVNSKNSSIQKYCLVQNMLKISIVCQRSAASPLTSIKKKGLSQVLPKRKR